MNNGINFNNETYFDTKNISTTLRNAPLFDRTNGTLLTEKNVQIDHLESKNFQEECTPVAMDKTANNFKSDITPEFAQKIVDLNKEHTQD